MTDKWIPAIVGAAQVIQRPTDQPEDHRGPIDLMADAIHQAAQDAGAPGLVSRAQWIGVAGGRWDYRNPGQLLAERLGCSGAATALASLSGSGPQELVGVAAHRIARGELEIAIIVGGEARWTAEHLRRMGVEPTCGRTPGSGEPERVSEIPDEMYTDVAEMRMPALAYALMEDSLRLAQHHTMSDHRRRISELWSSFSAIAADNPFAWDRTPHSTESICDEAPDNRMIAWPYTKAMVANNNVDMASALVLCNSATARSLGVPLDRPVFVHAVTTAHETWRVLNRAALHGAPALETAGKRALRHASVTADDVEHLDLYACFPSIVQMSATTLGFDLDRPLSVTGGLGFAGAPVGNAAGQSIAALIPLVRTGGNAFLHANGGNATKHAFGVYGPNPPARFVFEHCVTADGEERVAAPHTWSGPITVEAATVAFDREGPTEVFATALSVDGSRSIVWTSESSAIELAMSAGLAGRSGVRTIDGELLLG